MAFLCLLLIANFIVRYPLIVALFESFRLSSDANGRHSLFNDIVNRALPLTIQDLRKDL